MNLPLWFTLNCLSITAYLTDSLVLFKYENLWEYGAHYGAKWNLTIDVKCVDLTDDTGTQNDVESSILFNLKLLI